MKTNAEFDAMRFGEYRNETASPVMTIADLRMVWVTSDLLSYILAVKKQKIERVEHDRPAPLPITQGIERWLAASIQGHNFAVDDRSLSFDET
jgi:hypothetical protein